MGLSAEETAKAVGSTAGAVRVAQHRALDQLRDVLASQRIPDDGIKWGPDSTQVRQPIPPRSPV
jgi:hypothetical protein